MKYCPSMDLVATWPIVILEQELPDRIEEDEEKCTVDVEVEIWRLNGEKVFGINVTAAIDFDVHRKGHRLGVVQVEWRDDGKPIQRPAQF